MVFRLMKKQSKKAGTAPGTLLHVGEKRIDKPEITVSDYDSARHEVLEFNRIEDAFEFRDSKSVSWIDITGLHDSTLLEKIGKHFNIHPLVLEDIQNTDQRPKIDFYEDKIFVVLKMLMYNESSGEISTEQISVILGINYVITFQERPGDVFEPLRRRIKNGQIRTRRNTPDYLLYAIMDIVIDHYYLILEHFGEILENLDDAVLEHPDRKYVEQIRTIKRELLLMRRAIRPLRDVSADLLAEEHPFILESTLPFIRDMQDHIVQTTETIELFRDMAGNILDLYMSNISNTMNEVMKVLTLVASIFIPLTFIAGIYGMNFDYMPELRYAWAYPVVLIGMAATAAGLLVYFRIKRWL